MTGRSPNRACRKTRMTEFRCTRNRPYVSPTCLGHSDLTARQGYYINAATRDEALTRMAVLFPEEYDLRAGFTVQESMQQPQGRIAAGGYGPPV